MNKRRVIKISLSNKLFYSLIAVFAVLVLGIGVYAYGTSNPSTFGHSISEIDPPAYCGGYNDGWLRYYDGSWQCEDTPSTGGDTTVVGGISGYEIVEDSHNLVEEDIDVGDLYQRSVSCPDGKVVLGGGCNVVVGTPNRYIANYRSFPFDSDTWSCGYVALLNYDHVSSVTLYSYAICADEE